MPSSRLLDKLEEEYQNGELQDVSACARPFFLSHVDELRDFCNEFSKQFGTTELDVLMKLFILQKNMPFDMNLYMQQQRKLIQESLAAQASVSDPAARQKAVHDWIQEHAEKHRQEAILRQMFCFEKIKEQLLPEVRKALEEPASERPTISADCDAGHPPT